MGWVKASLPCVVGAIFVLVASDDLPAAEFAVTPSKAASVRVIHRKRARLVLDYDGTPVVVRRTRVVKVLWDGSSVVKRRYDLFPVIGGQASYYINGQPVLPLFPRSYPN